MDEDKVQLLESTQTSPLENLLHTLKQESGHGPGKPLACATCGHPVTDKNELIEVAGNSEHAFTNPVNITFQIVCYKEALGCIQTGGATFEHSWFNRYRWRFALCGNCHEHLGWHYESAIGNYFYGLIKDRLIEKSQPQNN